MDACIGIHTRLSLTHAYDTCIGIHLGYLCRFLWMLVSVFTLACHLLTLSRASYSLIQSFSLSEPRPAPLVAECVAQVCGSWSECTCSCITSGGGGGGGAHASVSISTLSLGAGANAYECTSVGGGNASDRV